MTPNILASLEQLEDYWPFQDFCDYLENSFTETVKKKLRNGEKMTAEEYARGKIYPALKGMPKKLRLELTPRQKKSTEVYE